MRCLLKAGLFVIFGVSASGCGEKLPPPKIELPYGKWSHITSKDPITDVQSSSVVLNSGPLSDGMLTPAELHIRCSQARLEFYISWNRYVGSEHNVDTRVDDDRHEPNRWSSSTDGKSSFYPYVGPGFLRRIRSSEKYIARVESVGGKAITAVFNTSKLNEEAGPTIDACAK